MELSSNTNSTPFRIGGVYRNHNGQVAVLRELNVGGEFNVGSFPADGPRWEGDNGYASHRLSDGWTSLAETPEHRYNLLPGELHQVNGEWVPVESPAKPAPAAPTAIPFERPRTQREAEWMLRQAMARDVAEAAAREAEARRSAPLPACAGLLRLAPMR